MEDIRLKNIFSGMKQRCNNKNNRGYKWYWWRWIKVEWVTFEDFKNDMFEIYEIHVKEFWTKQTTIDRYPDKDWNYCKNNCRRATYKEQANNQNRSKQSIYRRKNIKNNNSNNRLNRMKEKRQLYKIYDRKKRFLSFWFAISKKKSILYTNKWRPVDYITTLNNNRI